MEGAAASPLLRCFAALISPLCEGLVRRHARYNPRITSPSQRPFHPTPASLLFVTLVIPAACVALSPVIPVSHVPKRSDETGAGSFLWRISTELVCAVLLFTPYKFTASIVLFGLMSGVVLTHVSTRSRTTRRDCGLQHVIQSLWPVVTQVVMVVV